MNIMLIDDDNECLECLSVALRLNNFNVFDFLSTESALQFFDTVTIDVVITDYHLVNTTAIEIIRALKQKNAAIHVIIISGAPQHQIETLSLQAGAFAFFRKPITISTLIAQINTIPQK